jgi:hypothetical protein
LHEPKVLLQASGTPRDDQFRAARQDFALPLAPDHVDDEIDDVADRSKQQLVAVSIEESALRAQFGAPNLQVAYTFKGHPAEYAIYEMSPGKSFGRFTFIDGVLVDFADGGNTPLNQTLDGW